MNKTNPKSITVSCDNESLASLKEKQWIYEDALNKYDRLKARGLSLDMSRGKPSPTQLGFSQPMLSWTSANDFISIDGVDCRNYGGPSLGLSEARQIFSWILGTSTANIAVAGNSSLALMHDIIAFLMLKGSPNGNKPWVKSGQISFICPVPGYDRHFSILESFGITMLPVPIIENGPDMDTVEQLVFEDPSVKAMWCMPKYSNPTGITYSAETIHRLGSMKTAALDFHLFWDNAYAVHHLSDKSVFIPDILDVSATAGYENRAFVFASTSKITLSGSGLAALATSDQNLSWWQSHSDLRSIGPDKLNQLRHARFLKVKSSLDRLMESHRSVLAPKFNAVVSTFHRLLGSLNEVEWTEPLGGYFINLKVPTGCATRTVQLAADAGIVLTAAGASFPYRKDYKDCNIRIAPSFPTLSQINDAAEGIAVCVRLAIAESELE
ncbi:aminotransferase class I/II-fold pyridoxal phosphate-dependent enzyme [Halomonas llamarensis]|uniref:Aminotransferase class I/II-fold pyridoxal phosphate-dependent enzyme n=1 Tax=Halomonas llamarensis TaxID=2945104 RepID=A0ABT0SQ96_9GAMM|nr:aminotransferase class I/II-fold pyridoxal phosphate-dependent enzyme [Halomonas llamarensis]MCL7929911.1 aminotransferase class I/II-fold pyridoxal phosphate-dependent enzyme [Halomonas llamarensis]